MYMKSTNNIDLVAQKTPVVEAQQRSAYDSSLIIGITLIVIFLGLFVVEFTRILTLTGNVIHTHPASLQELAGDQSHAS